jgi:hypothetical protein
MFVISENATLERSFRCKRVFDFVYGDQKGRIFYHKEDSTGGAVTSLQTVNDNVRMALANLEQMTTAPNTAQKSLLARTHLFSQQMAQQLSTVAGLRFDAYTPLYT